MATEVGHCNGFVSGTSSQNTKRRNRIQGGQKALDRYDSDNLTLAEYTGLELITLNLFLCLAEML